MISNKLNQKIEIYCEEEIADTSGIITKSKITVATVWANINQKSSSILVDFGKKDNSIYYLITIRFLPSVKAGYKIYFNNTNMLITSVIHNIISKESSSIVAECFEV